MTEVYLFDGVRTPRGAAKDTGALHGLRPIELLQPLFAALEERNGLDTAEVEDVVLGCVGQTGEQGGNLAKIAALYAGWSERTSGVTLNRFCSSGLDACLFAAAKIAAGAGELAVAGGVESVSRVPMYADQGPWYADKEVARKTGYVPMGSAADLVATRHGISREEADAYALRSLQRSWEAQQQGRFSNSMISVSGDDGSVLLDREELVREPPTPEKLAEQSPLFSEIGEKWADKVLLSRYPELEQIHHIHHKGSSPKLADGACLLLLGSLEKGESLGLRPRARIRAMADDSVEPVLMLTGMIGAAKKAMKRAGVSNQDVELHEAYEAFAATVVQYQRELEADPERLNLNGGVIGMGHAMGATGAIKLLTLMDEMERHDLMLGVVSMSGGAGVGSAAVIERV